MLTSRELIIAGAIPQRADPGGAWLGLERAVGAEVLLGIVARLHQRGTPATLAAVRQVVVAMQHGPAPTRTATPGVASNAQAADVTTTTTTTATVRPDLPRPRPRRTRRLTASHRAPDRAALARVSLFGRITSRRKTSR